MKHNIVERNNECWTATILHSCGHFSDFARTISSHNNGEGCTIGKARKMVRAEAGMVCPKCREGKRVGRPRISAEDLTQHPVYLTPDTLATARKLGDGNVSAGVRSALAMVCDAHAALALAEFDGASPQARAALVNQIAAAERALRSE